MFVVLENTIRIKTYNGYDYKEVLESKRNWNDTSTIRLNHCYTCKKDFFGNKHRSTCRLCHTHPEHFPEDNNIFRK